MFVCFALQDGLCLFGGKLAVCFYWGLSFFQMLSWGFYLGKWGPLFGFTFILKYYFYLEGLSRNVFLFGVPNIFQILLRAYFYCMGL